MLIIQNPHHSDEEQADEFIDFFTGKIHKIRQFLDTQIGSNPVPEVQCRSLNLEKCLKRKSRK
jgi:hypothetical protein